MIYAAVSVMKCFSPIVRFSVFYKALCHAIKIAAAGCSLDLLRCSWWVVIFYSQCGSNCYCS